MAAFLGAVRFFTKVGIIGGTAYVVYDQDLLGNGEHSSEILQKVSTAVPAAVDQAAKYFGVELPELPKLNVPAAELWNTGVDATASFFSAAPSKCTEYAQMGWQYVKKTVADKTG
ncbi:MICOS complex subunit MIC13 [Scyliorhinus canicula]|uniref:MICOS complex subunit MIC13 n=1 Tax=Scyliorhinus canicula TaxID=7830 RepID=UPI0018F28C98|nr:MICOS complex subunit MIC13 [Scyliorhinus canicula]